MNEEFFRTPTLPGIPTPLSGTKLTRVSLVERVSDLGVDFFALVDGAPILVIQKDPYNHSSSGPKRIMAFALKAPVLPGFQMITGRGCEFPVRSHVVLGDKGRAIKFDAPIVLGDGLNDPMTEVLFGEADIFRRVAKTELALPVFYMASMIGFKFAPRNRRAR